MAKSRGDKTDLSVLFIGNSFTARNELPGLIAKMAAVNGKRIHHKLISAGGASLRRHWNGASARKEARVGNKPSDVACDIFTLEESHLPVEDKRPRIAIAKSDARRGFTDQHLLVICGAAIPAVRQKYDVR
jgi:hypothetical protein